MGALKDPHGGVLKNLYLDEAGAKKEKARARDLPSWDLNMRQLCDIEMLLNGAFSPLEGFLGQQDYERVVADMRLADGTLWPIPVTLDVAAEVADRLEVGTCCRPPGRGFAGPWSGKRRLAEDHRSLQERARRGVVGRRGLFADGAMNR